MKRVRDYLELSKSRIVAMVLVTTAAGYFFGAVHVSLALLINTLVGTALVAAGTNALNQYVERDLDARMRRTRMRPLPDGRIKPRAALLFSIAISVAGTAYLALMVNLLTAALGAFTLITYIFIYTPLKRRSTACTLIGAVPGAVPPLMGWTAATGALGLGGWIAFGIVFAMNSSVHSFLILSYSDNKKVAMNVGFYYMANAGGRLAGLLLSGLLYQWRGLDACLWAAVAFVLGAGAISLLLPKTAADARAAERVELPAAPAEQLRV